MPLITQEFTLLHRVYEVLCDFGYLNHKPHAVSILIITLFYVLFGLSTVLST